MDIKPWIIDEIKNSFSSFSKDLTNISNMITQSPKDFNPQVWEVIQSIFSMLLPVGYSLIALFFIIDFLNKSVMLEYVKWENVVKTLLKLVVAKLVIEHSFELLNIVFTVISNMLSSTAEVGKINKENGVDIKSIVKSVNEMDSFLKQLGFFISFWPMTLVMKGIKIAIYVIIYGRMVEIYILTAVAPLPLSTLTSEGMQSTAKRFFQNYVSVCLQGLIILVGCMIYNGMMVHVAETLGVWDTIRDNLIISFILLLIVTKSGTWAKQITGFM
jgi:hypothetical protein